MKEIAISCRGIKKHFGENDSFVAALKGIDLNIHKGELTLLVGPSGSGKTTLLSIITTILTPTEGELILLGQPMDKLSERDRALFCNKNLGIVFQSLHLLPSLSVIENIVLPITISGGDTERATTKGIELLTAMQLPHKASSYPTSLSKGQQQRVAIARAMINDSQILILDEPTSALDQTSGHQIMTLLKEKVLQSDRAVVVVTHDPRTFPFADRIINMNDGQIIDKGLL